MLQLRSTKRRRSPQERYMSTKTSLKKANEAQGELIIVRPSELAKNGTTGIVATGVYEGAKPNKFNPANSDYFIRGENNALIILNSTASLKEQLGQLAADGSDNATVEVVYNGKLKTKAGKDFHDFEVSVITK